MNYFVASNRSATARFSVPTAAAHPHMDFYTTPKETLHAIVAITFACVYFSFSRFSLVRTRELSGAYPHRRRLIDIGPWAGPELTRNSSYLFEKWDRGRVVESLQKLKSEACGHCPTFISPIKITMFPIIWTEWVHSNTTVMS